MFFPDLIARKRDGLNLKAEEIQWMIQSYVKGDIPDYQMSAMLMAIYFQGMNRKELIAMTRSMIVSGDQIDLSGISGIKVDKHSTGGVGDKVSLVLAPLVAAAGVPVPMMSGRSLGHTGGTLDKLEAIPGFRTQLDENEFRHIIQETGFAMIGQTQKIVPADKALYALRDVTGTVPSIPLICSSIISKKKAEGADGLVLDVKMGKGAFLKTRLETVQLAEALVSLGNKVGLRTQALLTNMDQPLGNTVGNWPETLEAIETLKGNGPADLLEVTLALGSLMLIINGKCDRMDEGIGILKDLLSTGEAFERFRSMVALQGGDLGVVDDPDTFPISKISMDIPSPRSGTVTGLDAYHIGLASMGLGAGRQRKEESVDPAAGLILYKKIGDTVEKGEPLVRIFSNRDSLISKVKKQILDAFEFSRAKCETPKLIEGLVDEKGYHLFSSTGSSTLIP